MPIFIGYFPTAIAFGLLCRQAGLALVEGVFSSLAIYGGSSQFIGVNLLKNGASIAGFTIGVALVNLRYSFEGAAVARNLGKVSKLQRLAIGFLTTDEVFSVSVLKDQTLPWPYMISLEVTSYAGWVSGTAAGFILGRFLSHEWKLAVGVTLYAMFSSIWAGEVRDKGALMLLITLLAGMANSVLTLVLKVNSSLSFVIAMLGATAIGALLDKEEA